MARSVSRGTRRNGGGQRRKLIWARIALAAPVVPATDAVELPLLSTFETEYGAQLLGCTVIRIRGWWGGDAVAAGEEILAGIRVIDDSTVFNAAGQGPVSSPHSDWMYYDVASAFTLGEQGGRYFDVKSMRKFEELGQGLSMIFEGNNVAGRTLQAVVSTLIALP